MSTQTELRAAPGRSRLWPRVRSVVILTRVPVGARRRATRSRTAVLAGLVGFFALQAGLNLGIRHDVIPVRDPIYAEKFELLKAQPAFFAPPTPGGPTRVVAIGSSRTQLGFDAARFAAAAGPTVTAFNFGCSGAGPLTQAVYLNRLLDAGVKPEVMFVEIHPGFFTPMDPPYEARWLHAYRLKPGEVAYLRALGWNLPTPPHHGWKGWTAASGAFRMGLLNRFAPVLLPCPYGLTIGARSDAFGYVAGFDLPPKEKVRALGRTHAQYSEVLNHFSVGGVGPVAVRDAVARCKAAGIRVAVVLMPESSEYREWYGEDGYAAVTRCADGITRDLGVPLFDAREWVPDAMHADGHHLTTPGGAAFTDRLAEEAAAAGLLPPRAAP